MELERRFLKESELELRAEGEEPPKIAGYAAVFDAMSEDLGGFREKIAPGAFTKALGMDVRALFNHDPSVVLGRTKAKTLNLREDNRGLYVEFTPPASEAARSVIESIRRGDIDQMSFGFRTVSDTWEDKDGEIVRTLNEVELFDVSVVTYPAYPQTRVDVRGLDVAKRSFEEWVESMTPPLPDFQLMRRKLELVAA